MRFLQREGVACRKRHRPKCQGAAARTWLAERVADRLPVGYSHVVFTLPAEVADIAWQNKALLNDLLSPSMAPHPRREQTARGTSPLPPTAGAPPDTAPMNGQPLAQVSPNLKSQ